MKTCCESRGHHVSSKMKTWWTLRQVTAEVLSPLCFFVHIQIPLRLWWVINTGTNHVQSCSFCWRHIYWVALSQLQTWQLDTHIIHCIWAYIAGISMTNFHHVQQALWKPFLTTDKYRHDNVKILSLFKKKKQKLFSIWISKREPT